MLVTLPGMATETRSLHRQNVLGAMPVTAAEIVTDVRRLQL
jgi:hypothetical protein